MGWARGGREEDALDGSAGREERAQAGLGPVHGHVPDHQRPFRRECFPVLGYWEGCRGGPGRGLGGVWAEEELVGCMGIVRECEGADRVLSDGLYGSLGLPFTGSTPFTNPLTHWSPLTASETLWHGRRL